MLEFDFLPFPNLSTERLTLREPTMGDLEDFFALRNNEKCRKYLDRPKETYEEVKDKMEKIITNSKSGDNILWIVATLENPKMIGTTGFWNFDKKNHRVEIGYSLFPEYWSKGIMTEANKQIIVYAFTEMRVHSISANINPRNIGSRKVLEKIGFRQEAHFTEDYYFDGRFTDSYIFSLLERWLVD